MATSEMTTAKSPVCSACGFVIDGQMVYLGSAPSLVYHPTCLLSDSAHYAPPPATAGSSKTEPEEIEEQEWERLRASVGPYEADGYDDWDWDSEISPQARDRILAALDTARTRYEASEAARDGQRESVARLCVEIDKLTQERDEARSVNKGAGVQSQAVRETNAILERMNANLTADRDALKLQLASNAAEIAGLRGQIAEAKALIAKLNP